MRRVMLYLLNRDSGAQYAAVESENMHDAMTGMLDASAAELLASGGFVLLHTLGMPEVHNPSTTPLHITYWQHARGPLAEPEALRRVTDPLSIVLYPGQRVRVPYGATAVLEVDPRRATAPAMRMLRLATALRVHR